MSQSTTQQPTSSLPYSQAEERLNTLTHGIGALFGGCATIAFIIGYFEHKQLSQLVTTSIYSLSLTVLMLASTLYHAATNPVKKQAYKLFDHCAIYLLIAGTYTPLVIHKVPSSLGYGVLGLVWLCAIIGIGIKLKFGSQYKKFSVMTYLVMGWLSLFVIYELIQALPTMALALLAGGGLVYSSGVYFYLNHKIPYNHAIWHIFVLLAAICHFLLIYLYI
ncbi:hemolysin III family protein [Psychrobium sp. MM17-31]|uniref:PAQR family membrane homeostasis protein TrhA n=1 Tax=Psychrobium sp. MM17-31 TaxID=2917758 RepID=UPI001EF572A5|nr:hemolysin III family protein [Psychrobium sp. MM17-31]MCG7531928.1 hemolysin III family protein [Psychrobium sp. MM17-31]